MAGVGWLMAKVTGGDTRAGAISGVVGGVISGLGVDFALASSGTGIAVSAILGYAGSLAQSLIYKSMTDKSFHITKMTQSEIKSFAISSAIGAAINVVSLGVGKALNPNLIRQSTVWKTLLYSLKSPLTKNFDSNLASVIMTKYLGLKQGVTDYIIQQLTS